ncbi:unnamed protein product [Litomosoides sigmodontis]|uniref:GSKIP domain-containing protein n=1 Tax=Litomosoides sigmodontis TaxID=42156 RepID=A0A3P6TSK3_LITSI|nr:unnamed protein product [Litomosoides sigmodontis]
MNEQREIIKASWLQHVIHKKGGTLHRKKKVLYEEGKWVVLCVHNGRIPLLEWYFSEEYVHGHRPSKVIDLLGSSFVRVIMSDPSRRSFMIGFMDCSRDVIELSALTVEDCDDWIRSTTSALVRLKCLVECANLYISAPDFSCESSGTTEQFIYDDAGLDEVPEEPAPSLPISGPRNSEYERIRFPSLPTQPCGMPHLFRTLSNEEKKMMNHGVVKTPPPLPPRNISSSQALIPKTGAKRSSIYDHPKNHASKSFGSSLNVEGQPGDISINPRNSVYSTFDEPTLLNTEVAAPVSLCSESMKCGYSVPAGTLNINIAHSRRISGNDSFSLAYDSPSGAISRIVPIEGITAHSASEKNSGMLAEDYARSQTIDNSCISNGLRNLTVQSFICAQHIAYMDFGGKVWVMGWTAVAEKYLTGQLFIGDQLVRIADVDIYNTQQIPFIISITSKKGLSVNITFQRMPHGTIYKLKKTRQKFDAGFILDKHKIKLADVVEGSPAWEAGIRPSVPAVTRTGSTPACITCVDKHALSIFSEDDEVFKQIDALPLLMAHSPPFTPPSSPNCKGAPSALSFHGVHPIGTPTVNCLADCLGVSPLYRQQSSVRWQSAAQIYQSYQSSQTHSRAHSPAPDGFHEAFMYPPSLTPALMSDHLSTVHNTFGTPLSVVEIGRANRKRHAEAGDAPNEQTVGGPLELEAIAAVHELSSEVRSIAVSEMLPRTADLIFVNVKTVEGHPYTLELTMKGWRIASLQCDSMNGDYKRVELHAKYYDNARQLLEEISPAHSQYFTKCLIEKLTQLHIWRKAQEEMEDVDVDLLDKQIDSASTSSKKESKENDSLSDEGLVYAVDKNSNK